MKQIVLTLACLSTCTLYTAHSPLVKTVLQEQTEPKTLAASQEQIIYDGTSVLPNNSWENLPNALYFYDSTRPYFDLSNFDTRHPFEINGVTWASSEHYFQAQKFVDEPEIYALIQNAARPRDALKLAREYKAKERKDWFQENQEAMYTALRAKFTQHPELTKLLLATDDQILVEDAGKNDAYWGAGADMKGTNFLGRMLMYIRKELQDEIQKNVIS